MEVYKYVGILFLIMWSKAEVEGGGNGGDSSSGGAGSMSAAAGAITGTVCGLYGIYVVVGSASVLIIYWLLPLTTGLLSYEMVLVSVGVVVSVAVFPIGLVLLITACCCFQGNGSGHKWNYRTSPSIVSTMLFYIIIFPLGIADLVLDCLRSKVKAQDVLISAGIVGSVVVFPIGLALLLTICFCCSGKKSEKYAHKKFHDFPDWLKFLFCIGAVTSGIIFPLGISILICYFYKKGTKDVEEKYIYDTTGDLVIYDTPLDPTIYDTPVDPIIYNTPVDPSLFGKFEPDTSENIAYGVLQGVPTTSNPVK